MAELSSLRKLEGKCVNTPHNVRKLPIFSPEGKDIYNYVNNGTIIHRNINSNFNIKTNREQQDGYFNIDICILTTKQYHYTYEYM
jgi:hypothetical protein